MKISKMIFLIVWGLYLNDLTIYKVIINITSRKGDSKVVLLEV